MTTQTLPSNARDILDALGYEDAYDLTDDQLRPCFALARRRARAGSQFTAEELAQIARSMKASIELLKGTKYAHRVPSLKAIEVKAASLAFMEVSRDA